MKQSLMISAQIFEMVGIDRVKNGKRCWIFCEKGSVKRYPEKPSLPKANILKHQILAKKYIKIDFSMVTFKDESRVTYDGPDGWANGLCLSKSEVPVPNRKQRVGDFLMILAGIVDQSISLLFKVDKEF